ncbi:branched-chain amino acid transport system permease protein [Acholeplasma morum]|uniref:branched-chain amino acid ABC transporter permease n=1 Tax=Paracholeplasma morum TaxID=264637 RepID=UPI00195657D2|nr:branched-chain amino acid ABC transporter permease [Paracholeplasma morum]MBM7453314.1 branched-chain amino acid transport system permease protein [Paracholeplasma morum]
MSFFIDIFISGFLQSAPLVLATFAIVLIFKTSFTTNFAQGMIGTVAAFVTTYIIMPIPDIQGNVASPSFLEYLVAILAGITVSFIFSMIIDVLIFRHSRYLNPVGKQIITMGVVLVITGVLPILFGISDRSLPRIGRNLEDTFLGDVLLGISKGFKAIGVNVGIHVLLGFIISFLLISVIFIALKYTKWGLGVRATASNEKVASMMGVNTKFITAMSWAIAGGLGAVAAILISSNKGSFGNVTTYFMISVQVQAFFAAILGGFSTFYGPVVGAIIFSILNNLFGVYFNPWGTTVLYLTIMTVVLFKPLGLFGKKIAKKV